ncbi:MAG TPA: NRDE family protein [Candidatus Acidoferrales bacterium]|nr:NRDE family protein [Candidatus Acidoferrales bacterium]
MCTLVFGLGTLGERTVLLATNRDENPARACEPPQVLRAQPRVVGGRDSVAAGTWLALRANTPDGGPAVALLLNRFDPEPGGAERRSRGLLTLDVAAADDPRALAWREAVTGRYAPCSLVWLSGRESWLLAIRAGRAPTLEPIAQGWHALSHFELDDPTDPRTAWLARRLTGFRPAARLEAQARLHALVTFHGDASGPPVCLHEGRAPTVSAARLWIAPGELAYAHAPGRPCTTAFEDRSALLRT